MTQIAKPAALLAADAIDAMARTWFHCDHWRTYIGQYAAACWESLVSFASRSFRGTLQAIVTTKVPTR